MHPLRRQIAGFLTEAARAGIKHLDKNSAAARELSALDIDAVLKEDIDKICSVMSFFEITKIISLVTQIKVGHQDRDRLKEEIKQIARKLMERVEKERGSLRIPLSCRDVLFEL